MVFVHLVAAAAAAAAPALAASWDDFLRTGPLNAAAAAQVADRVALGAPQPPPDVPTGWLAAEISARADPATGELAVEKYLRSPFYDASPRVEPPHPWTPSGPRSDGGRVLDVIALGDGAWAAVGASGTVWRSPDRGRTWEAFADLHPLAFLSAVASDAARGLVVVGSGTGSADGVPGVGLWESRDRGFSWAQIASADDVGPQINAVAVVGEEVLVASSHGLLVSSMARTEWRQLVAGHCDAVVKGPGDTAFAAVPGDAVYEVAIGSAGVRLERIVPVPRAERVALAVDEADGDLVTVTWGELDGADVLRGNQSVLAGGGELLLSATLFGLEAAPGRDCFGERPVRFATAQQGLAVAARGGLVYVGSTELLRSRDGGATFEQLSASWLEDSRTGHLGAPIHSLAFDDAQEDTLLIGTERGLFVLPDPDTAPGCEAGSPDLCPDPEDGFLPTCSLATFVSQSNGLGPTRFFRGATSPLQPVRGWVMLGATTTGTSRWAGSGGVWVEMRPDAGAGGAAAVDQEDNFVFYTDVAGAGVAIMRHRDDVPERLVSHGIADTATHPTFRPPFALDPRDQRRMMVATDALWTSDNVRDPDEPAWTRSEGSFDGNAVSMAILDDGAALVATETGAVYRCGATQCALAARPVSDSVRISSLVAHPLKGGLVYATVSTVSAPVALLESADGGATWQPGPGADQLAGLAVHQIALHPETGAPYLATDLGVLALNGDAWVSITADLWMGNCAVWDIDVARNGDDGWFLFAFSRGMFMGPAPV